MLRSVLVGGVLGNVFFAEARFEVSLSHAGFVVPRMVMVILFWECTFPPLVEIRENPEFHDLMRLGKAHWARCLLWRGWLTHAFWG